MIYILYRSFPDFPVGDVSSCLVLSLAENAVKLINVTGKLYMLPALYKQNLNHFGPVFKREVSSMVHFTLRKNNN